MDRRRNWDTKGPGTAARDREPGTGSRESGTGRQGASARRSGVGSKREQRRRGRVAAGAREVCGGAGDARVVCVLRERDVAEQGEPPGLRGLRGERHRIPGWWVGRIEHRGIEPVEREGEGGLRRDQAPRAAERDVLEAGTTGAGGRVREGAIRLGIDDPEGVVRQPLAEHREVGRHTGLGEVAAAVRGIDARRRDGGLDAQVVRLEAPRLGRQGRQRLCDPRPMAPHPHRPRRRQLAPGDDPGSARSGESTKPVTASHARFMMAVNF